MPGRYKRRRYGRRRNRSNRRFKRFGRRYGRRRPSLKITSRKFNNPAISDSVWIKLKYTDWTGIAVTGTTPGVLRYRGNSIYDPDQAGTGGQPTAFDQWAAFYKFFYVSGSKIRIRAWNSGNEAVDVLVLPSLDIIDASTALTNEMWAQPYAKRSSISDTITMKNLKHYMTTAKMFSVKKPSADMEFYHSAIADVSSTRQWYWNIIGMGFAGMSVAATTIRVEVELTYYIKCVGRTNLPQS